MMRGKGKHQHNPQSISRDHIRPRAWGGDDTAENRRLCCKSCNENRGTCGHCIGALACVRAVARDPRRHNPSVRQLIRNWKLGAIGRAMVQPGLAYSAG
jgi:hypothetical protein